MKLNQAGWFLGLTRKTATVKAVLFLLPLFSTGYASAQTLADKHTDALSNVQMEYTTCIAYYTWVLECTHDNMKAEVLSQASPTMKMMSEMGLKIARSIGMTQDAIQSRLTITFEEQRRVINNSCINLSSLYTRHAMRCKRLGENADSVFKECLNKSPGDEPGPSSQ